MNRIWCSTAIGAALWITAAYGQSAPPPAPPKGEIQRREVRQQKRIAQGVASGQLTPKETARVEHHEAKINREVRHDRKANGGSLTSQEKTRINRQQTRVSRQIYRQKHDGQVQK